MTVRNNTSIVLFGSFSRFTFLTLQQLLQQGFALRGVVLAAYSPSKRHVSDSSNQIYRSRQHGIIELANAHDLSICYFVNEIEKLSAFLRLQTADLFLLSCYPIKLPRSICEIAEYRCINFHPSKLPQFRGPDPVFWQLRSGQAETGITIHDVTDTVDGGGILHFGPMQYPEGARLDEIQSRLTACAVSGLGKLLETSPDTWHSQPQDSSQSNWQTAPCDADYSISCKTSARIAFNFVRAYSNLKVPIQVVDKNYSYLVRDAVQYSTTQDILECANSIGQVAVRFSDGLCQFSIEQPN